jgi:hypothetical protein
MLFFSVEIERQTCLECLLTKKTPVPFFLVTGFFWPAAELVLNIESSSGGL